MSVWFLSLIQFLVSAYFSTVPEMSSQQISPAMILVDVRSPDEYEVSHLRGAVNLHRVEDVILLARQHPDQQVVVYCSVGVRSGIVVRDALNHINSGYIISGQIKPSPFSSKIYNLQGGIFRWAIEGRPLLNQKGNTSLVHQFGWPWSYLLPADKRAQSTLSVPD
jgi:rhodanese-related sulfurtransferase